MGDKVREPQSDNAEKIWQRWEMYPEGQKQSILHEFRRRQPESYYNREQLLAFLQEKFAGGDYSQTR
jgi:hypothetical protein